MCLTYRSPQSHVYLHKLYTLQWLQNVFLAYFKEWEDEVSAKEGYDQVEKARMLLSHETLEGLRMTGASYIHT